MALHLLWNSRWISDARNLSFISKCYHSYSVPTAWIRHNKYFPFPYGFIFDCIVHFMTKQRYELHTNTAEGDKGASLYGRGGVGIGRIRHVHGSSHIDCDRYDYWIVFAKSYHRRFIFIIIAYRLLLLSRILLPYQIYISRGLFPLVVSFFYCFSSSPCRFKVLAFPFCVISWAKCWSMCAMCSLWTCIKAPI